MANEEYFKKLPEGKLSPSELALLTALKAFIREPHQSFPLVEWIERRAVNVIEIVKDASGLHSIRPFYETVSYYFKGEKTSLRWISLKASCQELVQKGVIEQFAADALQSVPEVTAKKLISGLDSKTKNPTGAIVSQLTSITGKDWMTLWKKSQAMQQAKKAAAAQQPVQQPEAPPQSGVVAPQTKLIPLNSWQVQARAGQPAYSAKPCPFLDKLPAEDHSEEELALMTAVLDYLEANGPSVLGTLARDSEVEQAGAAFLPKDVPLRAWIEKRFGGEFTIQKDAEGRPLVQMKSEDEEAPEESVEPEEEDKRKAKGKDNGKGKGKGNDKGEPDAKKLKVSPQAQLVMDVLPDEMTLEEEELREALLTHIQNAKKPVLLSEIGKDAEVGRCRNNVMNILPGKVQLREWIRMRMVDEVTIWDDPVKTCTTYIGIPDA